MICMCMHTERSHAHNNTKFSSFKSNHEFKKILCHENLEPYGIYYGISFSYHTLATLWPCIPASFWLPRQTSYSNVCAATNDKAIGKSLYQLSCTYVQNIYHGYLSFLHHSLVWPSDGWGTGIFHSALDLKTGILPKLQCKTSVLTRPLNLHHPKHQQHIVHVTLIQSNLCIVVTV